MAERAEQLSLVISPPHRNHYLFSDHYLNSLLPEEPRWSAALPEARHFLEWLQGHYGGEGQQLPGYNELQLGDHWFEPILARLGHTFEEQPAVPGLDQGIKRPDYVFFATERARKAAVAAQRTADYAAHALAVGEVKAWDVPLGKKLPGGGPSFEQQNPSYQIDYYLKTTGLDWGLLSNGRLWRLVHRDSSQRLTVYYELDLIELLRQGGAERMRYFTLFFQQAAFRPDALGCRFLDDALAASGAYAVALEEDLQQNVYQALEKLIQGFLDLPRNRLGPADLRLVYDNSLYLLYRLLFILYAESRDLLPLRHEQYREHYSLHDIKNDIAAGNVPTAPQTTVVWSRLEVLFKIINGEDESLNRGLGVPRYNGGLFNPALHSFLEEKAVGDQALVAAIDLLSRRPTPTGPEFADYRTLGERQLGSIYEGLLEYQPRYAAEEMVAVREGKREKWLPAAQAPGQAAPTARRAPGQVYLATDRGERKATGSYYTPAHIVKYIVENTLGPLVQAAAAANPAASPVDRILGLKVLDPAMGSGHFLVEAMEYLALALATDPQVESEASAEEDVTYWKRQVVERCIYGVDRNPLAVELAKLSLWLATVAADRPLSFLDHHLKDGDSLIGARVADLGWPPPVVLGRRARKQQEQQKAGQQNLFEYRLSQLLPAVMGRILEITGRESDSYETVQAKEAADEAVRQLKEPFVAVADLWVSAYFGNDYTPADYGEALEAIGRADLLAMAAVQRGRQIAQERRFLHWELAFPEVFYDQYGQPLREAAGFDAVIGNPPYDELSEEARGSRIDELPFLEAARNLAPALGYRINLYRLFITQALGVLRHEGWHGFIVPMSLLADQFTLNLRRHLLSSTQFKLIEQFPQKDDPYDRVFPDAKLSTCLYIIRNVRPENNLVCVRTHRGRFIEADSASYISPQSKFLHFDRDNLSIPGLDQNSWDIVLKMSNFPRLGEFANALPGELMINRQFQPYLTDAIEGEEVVRGSHISMYEIVKPKQGEPLYFQRAKYLNDHSGSTKALHHQRERVVYQRYAAIDNYRRLIATILPSGYFCSHTVGYLADVNEDYELGFLLALFNSTLLDWRFNLTSTNNNINGYEVEALPFPRITLGIAESERLKLRFKLQQLFQNGSSYRDIPHLLEMALESLDTLPPWLDVVHDLLAFLARQMITMNLQKREAAENFWLDLEGVADPATFKALRGKGKQEASLWAAEAVRPFVRQESRSARTLEESLAWNEDAFKAFVKMLARSVLNLSALVSVHRRHSPPYHDLTGRLAATDRLIDQIVYRLYGLTEEEIAIVEGRA